MPRRRRRRLLSVSAARCRPLSDHSLGHRPMPRTQQLLRLAVAEGPLCRHVTAIEVQLGPERIDRKPSRWVMRSVNDQSAVGVPRPTTAGGSVRVRQAETMTALDLPLLDRAAHVGRLGSGPPLTTYTPMEMTAIAIQSIAEGHSPRIGMAMRAVIAGHEAAKAAPLEAPRMLTARP